MPLLLVAISVCFVYIIQVSGFPIVAVAIAIFAYTLLSSAAWYFEWFDNRYLTTSIGTVSEGVRGYTAGVVAARNSIILESNSIFGQFLNNTVNVVFPYVVLGALFGASAGGRSLIKLAIVITRRLRGGTAHAAIVGSATFGTISGGPVVNVLGTSYFTAHMFVFYFAVASAIPPVAIAAFAASTISKAEPLATGFAAVRAGIVMFTIPFVFAFYPELLLIEQARLAHSLDGGVSAEKTYLPGYDGSIDWPDLGWLLFRLVVALYLMASALTRFDASSLSKAGAAFRIALAVLIILKVQTIVVPALIVALAYLAFHQFRNWGANRMDHPASG